MAEYFQIMQQLFFPGSLKIKPRVSFGPPLSVAELLEDNPQQDLHRAIIHQAQILLEEHEMRKELNG